jgi:hypothetical protein
MALCVELRHGACVPQAEARRADDRPYHFRPEPKMEVTIR